MHFEPRVYGFRKPGFLGSQLVLPWRNRQKAVFARLIRLGLKTGVRSGVAERDRYIRRDGSGGIGYGPENDPGICDLCVDAEGQCHQHDGEKQETTGGVVSTHNHLLWMFLGLKSSRYEITASFESPRTLTLNCCVPSVAIAANCGSIETTTLSGTAAGVSCAMVRTVTTLTIKNTIVETPSIDSNLPMKV